MAQKLHIDFETRSWADIKRVGGYNYSTNITTDIICLGYAFDDDKPRVMGIAPGAAELNTADTAPHSDLIKIFEYVQGGGLCVAHNAPFEWLIWNQIGVKNYGWPKLPIEQLDCTMARCYAMGLPGSLENASAALGLSTQKDAQGHRLMLKMSKPKKDRATGKLTWHNKPEDFQRLFVYCATDIEVERLIDRRVLPLSAVERKIWLFDQKVNRRGIAADIVSAKKAIAIVEAEQDRLIEELQKVTQGAVSTYNAHGQMKEWVINQGYSTPGVAKDDVLSLLSRSGLSPVVRRALLIRQEASKSSTAKLSKIVDGAGADGRLRGGLQYHGATTGRWAGRLYQPHNFPRKKYDPAIFEILKKAKDYATKEMSLFYGSPVGVISAALRGFLWSEDGTLVANDFNAIEARVVAWLAGEESVLDIFRSGQDIYKHAASAIFGVPVDKVTDEQRAVGKVAILALGYQGGVGAFQTMAVGYGVTMAPALRALWNQAPEERREWVLKRHEQYLKECAKKKVDPINKQEWLASELTKIAWREANPLIVDYWKDVEDAAKAAVLSPGKVFCAGPKGRQVRYKVQGSFLWCRLPSGRNLCYPYPQIREKETPWGEKRGMLTYMTEDSTIHQWVRVSAYGGLLVENITQAVSRDILAEAMLQLDAEGFFVVLHVHDETVVELGNIYDGAVEQINAIVSKVPDWAEGLPIKAEGWAGKRYKK